MRAVVFHGVGDIRLDEVPDPKVQEPTDAVVRLTASAICGTDLHFARGTMAGMREGTILGQEGVGVVEEVGPQVRNLRPGDRVVVPSTIGCGSCSYCRAGYFAQCDVANPNGPQAGTPFFGGPEPSGPFDGMQAELVRVPSANVGPVKLPDEVTDDQAILRSDIFPTAWFGAELAEVGDGDAVAVLGCGPVGQFAVYSALLQGAGRVFDAVGVDAQRPKSGPAAEEAAPQARAFPIGQAMSKNLTVKMGNCNHRRYLPELVTMTRAGAVDPSNLLTQVDDVMDAVDAYQAFDRREPGWIKVALDPRG